jgi:hypothetical protein
MKLTDSEVTAKMQLNPIPVGILREQLELVRLRAGFYVVVDTWTGQTLGRAMRHEERGSRWLISGLRPNGDKVIETCQRVDRLLSIIPQWARGYC